MRDTARADRGELNSGRVERPAAHAGANPDTTGPAGRADPAVPAAVPVANAATTAHAASAANAVNAANAANAATGPADRRSEPLPMAAPPPAPSGRLREIVVLSGKGGTGKTSLTLALAGCGPAKVLADCDVDAADMHLVLRPEPAERHVFVSGELAAIDREACIRCGVCAEHCRYGALEPTPLGDSFSVLEQHCEGCGVCAFVCPTGAVAMRPRTCGEWAVSHTRLGTLVHARLEVGAENSGKLVSAVRTAARERALAEGASRLLVDGPPGIGCPVIASLSGAHLALLVAEPTASALHDVERVISLAEHFRIPTAGIVNKADVNPALAERLEAMFRERGTAPLGRLPYSSAFSAAQTSGRTILEQEALCPGPAGRPAPLTRAVRAVSERLDALLAERAEV